MAEAGAPMLGPGVTDEMARAWRAAVDEARAELSPDIKRQIEIYKPQLKSRGLTDAQWERLAPLLREVVTLIRSTSAPSAQQEMVSVTNLALWAAGQNIPVTALTLFRASTVEKYTATLSEGSRRAVQSHLKYAVDAVQSTLAGLAPVGVNGRLEARSSKLHRGRPPLTEIPELPVMASGVEPATTGELAELGISGPLAEPFMHLLRGIRERVLELNPHMLRPQPLVPMRREAIPFGDVEIVSFLRAATGLRSAKARRDVKAAVLVPLGTGLAGIDVASVRGTDVAPAAGVDVSSLVSVRRASDGVDIPVFTPLAPAVAGIAREVRHGYLLGGGPDRRNRCAQLHARLRRAQPHAVPLDVNRVRATWLVVHLTIGTSARELLQTAGLLTMETIEKLHPYCPAIPEELRSDMLTGATRLAQIAGVA